MQSKDLRIGNLVKGNSRGGTHILDIGILKYIDETKSGYSPITLTEEWLVKFGFEKYTDKDEIVYSHLGLKYCDVYLTEDEREIIPEFSFYSYDSKDYLTLIYGLEIQIEYVHQLQNLYFALTGEELELKHESKP